MSTEIQDNVRHYHSVFCNEKLIFFISDTYLGQYCYPNHTIGRLGSQTMMGVQLAVVTQELELEGSSVTPDTVLGPPLLALAPVEHGLGHLVVVGE